MIRIGHVRLTWKLKTHSIPQKNSSFQHGDARRWVLKDDRGKLIGRIAAFYDRNKALTQSPAYRRNWFF